MIDATHDPKRRSWVASANGHAEFPIQNMPLGVFSPPGGRPRGGIAIGDFILDISAALDAGLFTGAVRDAAEAGSGRTLNTLLGMGAAAHVGLRRRVGEILDTGSPARPDLLCPRTEATLHLPASIGDYTDFFAGIHHASNTGKLFRPENPLMPNYKYVPVAYHGRASSVCASGHDVRRPNGQRVLPGETEPECGPSRMLDFELELGIWVGAGNALGEPVPIAAAGEHIAGFCLLNDWSARDIQRWEYQPLGPFLAKNFCTSVSPWIVTCAALAPFRLPQPPRPDGDPKPLPYLWDAGDQAAGGLNIVLEAWLETPRMRASKDAPHRLTVSNARHLYWTVAQMLAHHTISGYNLRPGDLFGSGTISAPEPAGYAALVEITRGGQDAVTLPNGETRHFLADGDEVILRAHCQRDGFSSIGFGECRGRVTPAVERI
jgi:fumarylacetoacetase